MRSSNGATVVEYISGFLLLLTGITNYLLVISDDLPCLPGVFQAQQLLNSAAAQFACQLPEPVLNIPQWFNDIWLLDSSRSCITYGSFQPHELDMVAAITAVLLLYVIINLTQTHRIFFKANATRDVEITLERSIP